MELLETQDPERKKLIETSDRHKRELEKEVKAISDKTERALKNALVIGGALALTYFMISQLTKTKSKRKKTSEDRKIDEDEVISSEPSPPSLISQLGDRIVGQATVVLLDIAKDMLMEYLDSRKKKNEDS
jgi:hypothetical protein